MLVVKNGLVHNCDTEDRYRSFKASGWDDYVPEEKKEAPKKTDKKTTKK